MKKITTSLFLFLFFISSVVGQSITKPFYFSVSLASEPYDDRIYGFRDEHVNAIRQKNLEQPPKPTRFLKMEIGYDFFTGSKLQLEVGLGMAKEWNTYYRSYDHCEIKSPCTYDLRYLDSYRYSLVSLNVNPKYQVIGRNNWKVLLGCNFLPSTRFNSKYQDPSHGERIFKKVDFFSLELNPNLNFRYRQYEVGFYYRLWQVKKVDRVIHTKVTTLGHPVLEEDFEKRNRTKIGLSLKYRFNFNRKKLKK